MTNISRQRKIGPGAVAGRVLAILGTAFVVVGALLGGYLLLSLSGTVSAQGTVISCALLSRGSCQPTVSFQTQSGQQITIHSSISSSSFAPGGTVPVRYHPDNPQHADVDPGLLFGLLSAIFGGLGLLLGLVGLSLFFFTKNHPSADLITRYYMAFQNQDYSTAFQFLNPSMTTPQGQPITQDWFTQNALAYDATHGKLTAQTITSYALNPNRAKLTVRVTRSQKWYKVHLSLLKKESTWKINSFDLF